jgi:ribosomal-protein-alanine N-acetyltransferase
VTVEVRLVSDGDAAALTAVLLANREFMAPWEPIREPSYFTEQHQHDEIAHARRRFEQNRALPCVIVHEGKIVGRVNLNNIVHGVFCSADLGYWVSQEYNGRGVATTAVAAVVRRAFDELGLHRVQAGTLVDNHGSQQVLLRNAFTRIGLAPAYLRIAGRWQDHLLFQRINENAD